MNDKQKEEVLCLWRFMALAGMFGALALLRQWGLTLFCLMPFLHYVRQENEIRKVLARK